MADKGTGDNRFAIARRGYDIDQVDRFLVAQAEAWRTAVQTADERAERLEIELAQLRALHSETENERTDLAAHRAEVEAEAASIVEAARAKAAGFEQEALAEARRKVEAEGRRLQERHSRLEADYEATRTAHEKSEERLRAKIADLEETRLALVTGLEAIAQGGLRGLAEAGGDGEPDSTGDGEATIDEDAVGGNGHGATPDVSAVIGKSN